MASAVSSRSGFSFALQKCRRNPRTSIGISSFRSRNGGMVMWTTLRRKNRSSRNFPSATIFSRFLFVAAIRRTSARKVWFPPTRSKARSSLITRSSFTCVLAIDLADFVQENGAAVGLLEPSDPAFVRAGERAAFVAEQFALEQLRRERRAMHRDEFGFVPAAQIVNRVSDQFLAGAAFAFDQDIRGRGRDLSDGVEHLAQRRRFADDVFESVTFVHLLTQRPIFLLHPAAGQGARDQDFDLVEVERLGHEIVGAAFHRFDRGVDRTVGRHHDADGRMRKFERALDQGHAVVAAETEIGDEQINRFAFEHVHRAANILGDVGIVFVLEQTAQPIARMLFVIDDQDGGLKESIQLH